MTSRTRTSTIRCAVVTALVTPALLLGPAADAAKTKLRDDRGDAPKSIDLTRLKVSNGKHAIRFKAKIPKLKRRKLETFFGVARPKSKPKVLYTAGFTKYRGKYIPTFGKNGHVKRCKKKNKIRFHRKHKWLVVKVPQKCYGKHRGKMLLAFYTATKSNKNDHTRYTHPVKRG